MNTSSLAGNGNQELDGCGLTAWEAAEIEARRPRCIEITCKLMELNPGRRFAFNYRATVIAVWIEETQDWREVVEAAMPDKWVFVGNDARILINGEYITAGQQWQEVN